MFVELVQQLHWPSISKVSVMLNLLSERLIALKFWSRDVLFVFPENGIQDLENWFSNYETDIKEQKEVKFGAIQAAICLEISGNYCDGPIEDIKVKIEGLNGILPNLDLINTLKKISSHRELQISTCFSGKKSYTSRLANILSMSLKQSFGFARNINSPLLKYAK